jgi:hypothetical protein
MFELFFINPNFLAELIKKTHIIFFYILIFSFWAAHRPVHYSATTRFPLLAPQGLSCAIMWQAKTPSGAIHCNRGRMAERKNKAAAGGEPQNTITLVRIKTTIAHHHNNERATMRRSWWLLTCTALVVVITNKTRIKFHPLRGLQFAETLLFFLLLLHPLRGLGCVQRNMVYWWFVMTQTMGTKSVRVRECESEDGCEGIT